MMIWERVKVFLALGVCLIFFSGCAGNLFKSMDSVGSDPGTKLELANTALDQGNYTQAKKEADVVIADPNATEAQRNDAYMIKAEATLGEARLKATTFATNVLDVVEDLPDNASASEYFNALNEAVPDVSVSTLQEATDILNDAEKVGSELSSDEHLTSAVANGLVAVLTITDNLTLVGGNIEASDDNVTKWEEIEGTVLLAAEAASINMEEALGPDVTDDEQDLIDTVDEVKIQLLGLDESSEYYFLNEKLSDNTTPNPNYDPSITKAQYLANLDGIQ